MGLSEQEIRAVFENACRFVPGTKYTVCRLDDDLDFTGFFRGKQYNYAVLFYFPFDEAIWEHYSEKGMATLQSRAFPTANRLAQHVQALCDSAGLPFFKPFIAKDHMTAPYIIPLSAKAIGVKGGAGWIGRSDLLVTFAYGTKITTMAGVFYADSFTTGEPVRDNQCGNCHCCVDACPFGNIYGNAWHDGVTRDELVDYHMCSVCRYEASTSKNVDIPDVGKKMACCKCMVACPVGRKNVKRVIEETQKQAVSA